MADARHLGVRDERGASSSLPIAPVSWTLTLVRQGAFYGARRPSWASRAWAAWVFTRGSRVHKSHSISLSPVQGLGARVTGWYRESSHRCCSGSWRSAPRLRAVVSRQFAAAELVHNRVQDVRAALGRLIAGEFEQFSRVVRRFGRIVVVLRQPIDLKYLAQRFDSVPAVAFGNRNAGSLSRKLVCPRSARRATGRTTEAAKHAAREEKDQKQHDSRGDRSSRQLGG